MAFPAKHLSEDEHVVFHLRTHVKALLVPVFVLLVPSAAAGVAFGFIPQDTQVGRIGRWVALGVAVVVVLRWVIWPFLTWMTTTYTVTTERLITRTGVITRVGRDIPLGRINDVAYEQELIDRLLRCGTLVVSAASEQGQIRLRDVPQVHSVQLKLSELVREEHEEYGHP